MRAQFEILGLVVVVLVISVAVMMFIFLAPGERAVQDPLTKFQKEQLTQSLVDAAIKTSIPSCPQYEYSDAIYWILKDRPVPAGCDIKDCTQSVEKAQCKQESFEPLNVITVNALEQGYGEGFRYQLNIFEKTCADIDDRLRCPPVAIYPDIETQPEMFCNRLTNNVGEPGLQRISLYPSPETAEIVLSLCDR